jgi:hypothetical protein
MAIGMYELSYAVAYVTFALDIPSSFARSCSQALVVKSWRWADTTSYAILVSTH